MNITKVEQLNETIPLSFEWKGETVNMDVYRNTMTPGFMKNVASIIGYPKVIAEAVKKWDVTTDDVAMYPLTEEELEKLPVDFLVKALNTISETWTGDEKKQSASASG